MASLTGNLVAETYKALLKTIDNDILTASEKQITDGLGGGSNVFIDSQGFLRANKYKVTNGLATQFLKADGSLDANSYLTSITGAQVITALGYTPVTNQRTLTINGVTYNLTANRSWTVEGTAAVWGNITGTLSNQTDLQNALNAKFDDPTGNTTQYIDGTGALQTFPTMLSSDNLIKLVRNQSGGTMTAGTIVYINGATGNKPTIAKALATSDATSAQTYGMVQANIANNADGYIVVIGNVNDLDTHSLTEGAQLYLSATTAGAWTTTKQYAPAHLVYVGIVLRSHPTQGIIGVKIQNGYELDELHDVSAQSPTNNDGIFFEASTSLWKNKSIATVLGYTPQAQLSGTGFVKASGTTISYDNSTYLTTADAASTYQLLTNLSTDLTASATKYPSVNAVIAGLATKQNQLNGTGLVRMDGTTVSYDNNSYATGSGAVGYISKWNTATGLANSSLYESSGSIGLNTTNVNYSAYGRAFTGGSFATSSFGYEIASGATADGGLLGGLAYVLISNDASRRIGAKIESNVVGTTATNLGADLKFFVKANNAAIGEIARMTSSGVTFYTGVTANSFVKSGGTSTQYLKADGSVAEITGDIISGAGSAGYIPKWTSAIVIGSSLIYDSGTSIGIGSTNVNYGAYGRSLTGSGFASNSFGFEAATASTTNGGLIGGLTFVISGNDSTRRIGSQIQSYISGATSTHQGADLRFYVKPDNAVLLEVVRMTSSAITFNKDLTATNITATAFIKSGGLSTEFLMADGSVSTLSSPVTGSGSAGYIPKWTTAANIGSSLIYDDGTSIGIAYSTPNKGGYGRTLTGAAFGSASFGFEAVGGTTTNGGLVGGLSFILSQNDASRIVGSAIQSNLVGTTATNYGADLRFFAKADAGVIGEVARMTSAGLRVYGTIVKDGGTSSQFLMADGSVSTLSGVVTGSGTINYLPKWTSASSLGNSLIQDDATNVTINGNVIINSNKNILVDGDLRFTGTDSYIWSPNVSGGYTGLYDPFSSKQVINYVNGGSLQLQPVSGNVGIGLATAYDKLDVNGSIRFRLNTPDFTAVIDSAVIDFVPTAVFSTDPCIRIAAIGTSTVAAGIRFFTGTSTNFSEKGRFFANGNLFIGSSATDAGYKLDVNGTGRFVGTLNANSILNVGSDLNINRADSDSIYTGGQIWLSGTYTSIRSGTDHSFNIDTYNSGSLKNAFKIIQSGASTFLNTVTINNGTANQNIKIFGDKVGISRTSDAAEVVYFSKTNTLGSDGTANVHGYDGIVFRTQGAESVKLTIASTGAATFSNSLSAGSWIKTSNNVFTGGNDTGIFLTGATNDFSYGLNRETAGLTLYSNSSSTARLTISPAGNTIIGSTTDAGYKLDVNGTSIFRSNMRIEKSISYGIYGADSFSINAVNTSTSTSQSGNIAFTGYSGNGTSPYQWGYIAGEKDSAVGDGYYGGSLTFWTTSSGGNGEANSAVYKRLTISRLGYLGVNTSSPSAYLHINGSSYGNGLLITTSDVSGADITLTNTGSGGKRWDITSGGSNNAIGAGGLQFYNNTDSSMRMGITSGGNVGINTSTPGQKLEVAGAIKTSSNSSNFSQQGFQIDYYDGGSVARLAAFKSTGVDMTFSTTANGEGGPSEKLRIYGAGNALFASYVTATAFYESSDIRLKTLIESNPIIKGIEKLEAKLYEKDGKIELGYFAQDAEMIMPYAVTKNADGFLNLSYREVHTAKIARLEQRVAELEKQLNVA